MNRDAKLVAMMTTLLQLTRKGKIQWEETLAQDGFRCTIPNGSAIISWPPHSDVCFMIFDGSDRLLETFSPGFDDAEVVTDLYHEARLQALGVDRTVDAMLAGLNQMN